MTTTDAGIAAPRLGIAMPLANEEETIVPLLRAVTAQMGPDDRLFCVLDRASRDRTRALIEEFGAHDPRVAVVWAEDSRCAVDAYFAGYRVALAAGCRWILEMDGGFSHSPDEIPRFIRAMESGAQFAAGSRFVEGGTHVGSFKRRLVSWGGTKLSNLLLGTRMRDMTSGFECFTREALERVVAEGVRSRAHFFQTEIRVMMHDLAWVEVPITYKNPSPRLGGASLKDALRNLWRLRRERTARDRERSAS